jgi:RNA polymerase sigma factor (sigma-70 family)
VGLLPFQAVVDRHGGEILRFLRRAVGPQEADDCFQETFLAALRSYPELVPGSDVRAWLFAIARSKAVDRFRRAAKQPLPTDELPEASGASPQSDSSDLWAIVRRLPEKQRLALGYRFAADLSYRQIASLLEISEPAARQNVTAGLRRLREVIE